MYQFFAGITDTTTKIFLFWPEAITIGVGSAVVTLHLCCELCFIFSVFFCSCYVAFFKHLPLLLVISCNVTCAYHIRINSILFKKKTKKDFWIFFRQNGNKCFQNFAQNLLKKKGIFWFKSLKNAVFFPLTGRFCYKC